MPERYEIRVYKHFKNEDGKWKKPGTFYGVWDNKINNWVINARGIGKQNAKKIIKALNGNTNVNRPKPFWRE